MPLPKVTLLNMTWWLRMKIDISLRLKSLQNGGVFVILFFKSACLLNSLFQILYSHLFQMA